ncbi:hypothetical protein SK875_p00044 (plasmid) [Burkholderia contaminans]|jgi:hypothetical protein|nr:hypothetical protein SK875_p00044 [Burkholderia contaminans]
MFSEFKGFLIVASSILQRAPSTTLGAPLALEISKRTKFLPLIRYFD